MAGDLCYCDKCGRTMDEKNFYTYKDGRKTEMCKKCLTLHLDAFKPDTFLWILEKLDVPYIPKEWNVIRDRAFAKDPTKMNGTTVFGKYLSKMKLNQWNKYTWADNERLTLMEEEKVKSIEAARQSRMDEAERLLANGEMSEAEYKTIISAEDQYEKLQASGPTILEDNIPYNPFQNGHFMQESEMTDLGAELTEEDKLEMAMKWGRLYKPHEWVLLEKDYQEMCNSFDIQDADSLNTLILICKTNLKMNQALDNADIDGFQKLSRVSESLRKSAKFTAAQNKEQKADAFDSIGELVAYCEKEGGVIPKFEIKVDLDIVDKVIRDLKDYTKSLIMEDKALAKQIEDYLKKLEIAEQHKQDLVAAKDQGLDTVQIEDEDYEEYFASLQEQKMLDDEIGDEE